MPVLATDESLIGYVLADKYRVLRVIGKGGMGIVYEAEHVVLGKHVAIKLMLEKYFEDGEAKTRFKREAIAASKIGNPHIIDVSDIGELPDGRLYVVMELLNGKPLADELERVGRMPPPRAIAIMRQVLRAVGAAHAKGIIHRDLKPDNIFLIDQGDNTDFVKLLDFGISKVLDPDEQVALTKLTTTGVVMGTPLYMAPEQAMGQAALAPADIYACGVILYEMLGGRTPFVGQTYAILVAQLLTAAPEPLQNVRPGLQLAVVNAVHRALEKDPDRRFPTAEMFAASLPGERTANEIELAGTLDSGYAVARIPTGAHGSGKRRGTWLAIGGALVLGVATAGILIATQAGKGSDAKQAVTADVPPPPAAPKQDDPPATKTGLLKIVTLPAGARVFVDGTDRGIAPLEITLSLGKHEMRLELADYEVLTTNTIIEPGSNNFTSGLVAKAQLAGKASKSATASKPAGSASKPAGSASKPAPTAAAGGAEPAARAQPIGPQRPPIRVEDLPPDKKSKLDDKASDKPPGNGKANPYTNPGATKGNPYTNSK